MRTRTNPLFKTVSIKLLLVFVLQLGWPTISMALTGGPSQPEVQGFTPIGTSEMVNLFTGDFNYNIPLLDVDGYPINISYSSGVGPEDEASWVGLGWTLNVGAIVRNMRGLPDDFSGDEIETVTSIRPSTTVGLSGGGSSELFGLELAEFLNLEVSAGFNFNNYQGFGFEKSVALSINSAKNGYGPLTGKLGVTEDSNNGVSIQPSLSLNTCVAKNSDQANILGLSLGTAYNTRSGLKSVSFQSSLDHSATRRGEATKKNAADYSTQVLSASFDVGQPTYSPTVGMEMVSTSISGRFTVGAEFFGVHPNYFINGYLFHQAVDDPYKTSKAYGYMNLAKGEYDSKALHDFNREKDFAFNEDTPVLPIANMTYDIFSVNGQGIGGSYRAYRGDVGHVYDAKASSSSDGADVGVELGVGNIAHTGGSLTVNSANSTSGKWTTSSNPFYASQDQPGSTFEEYHFREASEPGANANREWMASLGGDRAARFVLDESDNFDVELENILTTDLGNFTVTDAKKPRRDSRNSVITTLTNKEVKDGLGIMGSAYEDLVLPANAKNHHISEICALSSDGSRYFYSVPLYNNIQKEVTFAMNQLSEPDYNSNLISYLPEDASTANDNGTDHYYNSSTTPPYAHSYLLTAIVSPEFVDSDDEPGPTLGDIGQYTLFKYEAPQDYNWKSPVATSDKMATLNEGVRCNPNDDKASYVYGSKEIRYLKFIETKNYVCEFVLNSEARTDALGVEDEEGLVVAGMTSRYLKEINLYTRYAFENMGEPFKSVHFEYDYSLCGNVPNSNGPTGKLTLKGLYFTYENSMKGKLSPYAFEYASNPGYGSLNSDRWGCYQQSNGSSTVASNMFFPYTDQTATAGVYTNADLNAAAWHLTKITLPSSGEITVNYEADDYAFVQNKPAMQMYKIVGTCNELPYDDPGFAYDLTGDLPLHASGGDPFALLIKIPDQDYYSANDVMNIVPPGGEVYLKCAVNITPTNDPDERDYDFVPMYAKVNGDIDVITIGTIKYGRMNLQPVTINDNGGNMVSPISKRAIEFGRLNAPRQLYGFNVTTPQGTEDFTVSDIGDMVGSLPGVSVLTELLTSPNNNRFIANCGKRILPDFSFVRLLDFDGRKKGGGARVKSIRINDNWVAMAGSGNTTTEYGQDYFYTMPNGTSSGVASYEPMIGADENPWRSPMHYDVDNAMFPDESRFIEKPVGESFFPSPSVGYSRVTVIDHVDDADASGTGKLVHTFFTAKDFPTVVEKTDRKLVHHKTPSISVAGLLGINSKDFVTISQGFAITTNDMHGKPKTQEVYQEGVAEPISSVKYRYQETTAFDGTLMPSNEVTMINPDGSLEQGTLGLHFDMYSDMRQSVNENEGAGLDVNLDSFFMLGVPTAFPRLTKERVQFRSAAVIKHIQRFGVLYETIAEDNTSVVSTKNLAYDAITGQTLVTETNNNYDDKIYSLTVPAHWHYDGMGPAYKNIHFEAENITVLTDGTAVYPNADDYFSEGDEIICQTIEGEARAWITAVDEDGFFAQLKNGAQLSGDQNIKVIRSGRRNLSATPIAQITLLTNPLEGFSSNLFENVLQASSIEFEDTWGTYCDCFSKDKINFTTINPYVSGSKGTWRPTRNYAFLTDRAQSIYNLNTNIRKDGVFTSFNPFYFVEDGIWKINKSNWTWASEITQYSPFGQEVENMDALNRYSAAHFGYHHTLPIAVAANASYADIGFNNFEDYDPTGCGVSLAFDGGELVLNRAHTGKHSIKVTATTPATYNFFQWEDCVEEADSQKGPLLLEQSYAPFGVEIINGVAPYQVQIQVLQGSASVSSVNGNIISISATANTKVKVIVKDGLARTGQIIIQNF